MLDKEIKDKLDKVAFTIVKEKLGGALDANNVYESISDDGELDKKVEDLTDGMNADEWGKVSDYAFDKAFEYARAIETIVRGLKRTDL